MILLKSNEHKNIKIIVAERGTLRKRIKIYPPFTKIFKSSRWNKSMYFTHPYRIQKKANPTKNRNLLLLGSIFMYFLINPPIK